jgi:hypothetical protein
MANVAFATEECAAFFQAGTDEHWGADCSKYIKAISVYTFDRHFQIARATGFRLDGLLTWPYGWWLAEKTGNVQDCIEYNAQINRGMDSSYMRAAPPPNYEIPFHLSCRGAFVGVEAHHQHMQPRRNLLRLFEYAGINNVQQAEEGYRSSAEFAFFHAISKSSADGLTHIYSEQAMDCLIRAELSFTEVAGTDVDLRWLDDLPPADATTLHCTGLVTMVTAMPRVLVAEGVRAARPPCRGHQVRADRPSGLPQL